MKRRLAAVAELGVDGRDDDVDLRVLAVGDEDLLAVEDPVVALALGAGAEVADVGAGLRLGDGEGPDLGVLGGAEHLGRPLEELLGVPTAASAERGSPVPKIASPIPAQPQKISSIISGRVSPVGSCWACR